MRKSIWLMATMAAVLLVTPACQVIGKEQADKEAPRTYFESLNLETPEEAVQTFAEAFQREDFLTVYLVLDAESQKLVRMENAQKFSWRHLVGEDSAQDLIDNLDYESIREMQFDYWYFFDQIMLYAAGEDDLLIDLRGDLKILRSEDARMPDGQQAKDVIATVDGVSGEVTFRMAMDNDGRWRVYKVSAPDEGVDAWPSTLLE